MENRFSTMTEVRNVLWPHYERPEWNAANFLQGIAGTLASLSAREPHRATSHGLRFRTEPQAAAPS
jgi:two-component sensor histidine kinase